MLIAEDWLNGPRLGRTVLTIGVFAGVHLGHAYLVGRTIERAKALNASSLVLTFDPHPLVVLSPAAAPETLTGFKRKAEILEAMGLSVLGRLRFDAAMSDWRPFDFLDRAVGERTSPQEIYVGQDFHFGRGAEGDLAAIKAWGEERRSPVLAHSLRQVKGPGGETYSSSRVRGLLREGLVREAAAILGRPYDLFGTVVKGEARGRLLGYPTANLGHMAQLIPGPGVYATRVKLGQKDLLGMTSVGYNPTFKSKKLTVETFIFDFSEDFYGENMTLSFIDRLRGVIRFSSPESLVRQLSEDEKQARAILAKTS
jgi:riboflavin kinase/FMN adenylyltransferase